MRYLKPTFLILSALLLGFPSFSQTTSLWLFDESTHLYPSSVLENSSDNDFPLVLGLGGKMVPGRYGNALEISEVQQVNLPKGDAVFGLTDLPVQQGRANPPLTWKNAHFAAMMTAGQKHLRNQIGFANVTETKLNLGAFDWTVETWISLNKGGTENRFLFEIGQGPLLEKNPVTALYLTAAGELVFQNDPSGSLVKINAKALKPSAGWQHLALVYDHAAGRLIVYLDGKEAGRANNVNIKALPAGEEAYMSIGRDGNWNHPLNGKLDELKFSAGKVYTAAFRLPPSNSFVYQPGYQPPVLKKGLPLLFAGAQNKVLALGSRKHVFIDSAFVENMQDLRFVVNPPKKMEIVIDNIKGQFRKHLTVVEDEKGEIRIYNGVADDYLGVFTSTDGVHFAQKEITKEAYKGYRNIVINVPNGGLGNPFIDPNGPPQERWKFISDYHRRGVYLYTSPDGYTWTRKKTALLPFRSGTQSCTFYDDQRQTYVSYHRSDIGAIPNAEDNIRSSALTQFTDPNKMVDYKPLSQKDYLEAAKTIALRDPLPWYLDNGPLTPGGFGLEFPHRFDPIPGDPPATDIYVTKAIKYAWAPDTYLAFPIVYFHYESNDPARNILGTGKYMRGTGPLETQLSVSRDGLNWHRYPRPAYVGVGMHEGRDVKTAYLAQGMVKRGSEIWQYYFGETQFHSALKKDDAGRAVYRLVQRLDGFVSLDSPYEKEAVLVTKPFTFTGNSLQLNIDTDAAGYAQVGFLDENNNPIPGFGAEECVYINGDFVDTPVEWLNKGADVSSLQGKTVKLMMKMRGSKLYALQFVNEKN